jgi:hypothetical protein
LSQEKDIHFMSFKRGLVAVVLCFTLILGACSTAWISEAGSIVAAMIPAAVNIITLISELEGKQTSAYDVSLVQGVGSQVAADLQLLQSLITQYEAADATAKPGILSKITVIAGEVQGNLNGLLPALHISDPATQAKVQAVVGIVLSEVNSLIAVLPAASTVRYATSSPSTASLSATHPTPLTASQFVVSYNATLTAKTGNADVDKATAGLKIHLHSKMARTITLGLLK